MVFLCVLPTLTCGSGWQKALEATGRGGLPATLGWHEIPKTQLATRCPANPALQGNSGCRAVISAWDGGIADTRRNRLLFFGGGHFDYYGNEVYALDLNELTLTRLTEPSDATNLSSCPEAYGDERPSARHTYNRVVYLPSEDAMFVHGGAKSPCGTMSDATWVLDLGTLQWSRREPHQGDTPAATPGVAADFDPVSGLVFLTDTRGFFSYDARTNTYTRLKSYEGMDYHLTGVIDPPRRLFFLVGGTCQFWSIDIRPRSKYELRDWSRRVRGCETLMHTPYPGLAYDPRQRAIVGWAGGDTAYVFRPDAAACTAVAYRGGPGASQPNGTHGRF